jgi:hypothetical protein
VSHHERALIPTSVIEASATAAGSPTWVSSVCVQSKVALSLDPISPDRVLPIVVEMGCPPAARLGQRR